MSQRNRTEEVTGGGVPVDSWEELAGDSDPPTLLTSDDEDLDDDSDLPTLLTSDDEDCDDEEDDGETRSKMENVNVVFIGHVYAGRSTIRAKIMALIGTLDNATIERYEREAKKRCEESWYISWARNTYQDKRESRKAVKVGRFHFETNKKHYELLDTPGHYSFVPHMIGKAAKADLAVLVISARKGEFETGFDRGGQTREHAMLAKTAGVKHMVVLINKMDDPTVQWSEERFNECRKEILPYLKNLGFHLAKNLTFMPVSGLTGLGLKEQIDEKVCPWYRGEPFITFIDNLPSLNRKMDGPFLMPVVKKYKDMGTVVMGKVERGEMKKGQSLILMPNRTPVVVDQLWSDDEEVTFVRPGENIKVKLKGIEKKDVSPGFVLCDPSSPVKTGKVFDAQVIIIEHEREIRPGEDARMRIHGVAVKVTVKKLICSINKANGNKLEKIPRFVRRNQIAIMRIECAGIICLEQFNLFPHMGRFELKDAGETIAIGKVLKIIE